MERQIATCSLVSGQQTRRESAHFYALPLAAIADQSNHERLALNHNNTACHVLLTDLASTAKRHSIRRETVYLTRTPSEMTA